MEPPKTYHQGFTLIELLLCITIVAISLTLGLPAFKSTIASSRLTSAANNMLVALQLARSESIKQVKYAGVSIHTDSTGNIAANKWITFLESSSLPTSTTPGTGSLLQSFEAGTGITVSSTNDTPTYRSDGRLDSSTAINITFTSSTGGTANRVVTVSPSGRVSIVANP